MLMMGLHCYLNKYTEIKRTIENLKPEEKPRAVLKKTTTKP